MGKASFCWDEKESVCGETTYRRPISSLPSFSLFVCFIISIVTQPIIFCFRKKCKIKLFYPVPLTCVIYRDDVLLSRAKTAIELRTVLFPLLIGTLALLPRCREPPDYPGYYDGVPDLAARHSKSDPICKSSLWDPAQHTVHTSIESPLSR